MIEDFVNNNLISKNLKNMALGNAYYMAARISYFDRNIPGKKYLFLSFKHRKGWVEEAKIHEIIYILLSPVSRFFNPIINKMFEKFSRSNYGT